MEFDNYNDEMYNYLTEPNNYRVAANLKDNLIAVEKKLQKEFWAAVTDELKLKVEEDTISKEMKLTFATNLWWFEINSDSWRFYQISTENSDVGIKRVDGVDEYLKSNEELTRNIVESNKVFSGGYKSIVWPCWRRFNYYSFNTKETMACILPSVRKEKITECVNDVFDYLKIVIELCNVINNSIRERY